jgi:hypothetical protein
MKRIIKGKTYDTDTSTCVAIRWYEEPNTENRWQADLWLTPDGELFEVHSPPEGSEVERLFFEPVTRDEAEVLLTQGEHDILDPSVFEGSDPGYLGKS